MPSTLQRPHALIVSDDLELSDFLGEGLVYAGFWTSVIASAMQALEVFRLRSFDIILLDATLGGIGALELVRRLRGRSDRAREGPRTDIPIVVIAAERTEIDIHAAERAGADEIVLAPIELADLAQVLQHQVLAWRQAHPDRPWADAEALGEA